MPNNSSTHATLFSPARFGDLALANRIVMAPLTRNRAGAGLVPSPFAAEYYSQRASAGLIITEATQISREAQGYLDTPGLYTDEQIAGWRKVTDAVHAKGGRIVAQLWHVGRIAHVSLLPEGVQPVAPSALRANAKTFTRDGFVDVSPPRALTIDEIPTIVDTFRTAAQHAIEAGFDGVEVHGANGYLIDQFLRNGANKREDAYGGSIENRTRFLIEVVQAVVNELGCGRVGVRLSPVSPAGDLSDSDPQPLFERAVERLDTLGIAYVHVIEGATGGDRDVAPFDYAALHGRFSGAWIVNNGYDRAMAIEAIRDGHADAVAFGVPFLANPDLPARLRQHAKLNKPDPGTFYGGGAKGYTDYPTLEEEAAGR